MWPSRAVGTLSTRDLATTMDSDPAQMTVSPAEDRNRQLTAAAWILGWIGGPLPAVMILLVTRTPTWSRRLIGAAAGFWAVMWVALIVLIAVEADTDVPGFAAWWIGIVVLAFVVTVAGARAAWRSSASSPDRTGW